MGNNGWSEFEKVSVKWILRVLGYAHVWAFSTVRDFWRVDDSWDKKKS